MIVDDIDPADLEALRSFLPCATPQAWIDEAITQHDMLLLNHCYLEQCAARTALTLIFRCPDKPDVLVKMSRLAREELRHFEKVLELITKRGLTYRILKPSRYATRLNAEVRKHEPGKLIDTLIVGAFIEARSCERFHALAPHLDEELELFYRSLLRSEARHYQDYLALAKVYDNNDELECRIEAIRIIEHELITSPDEQFRFHSGIPTSEQTNHKKVNDLS